MVNRRKFRITALLMALLTLFTAACGAAPEAETALRLIWHGSEVAPEMCFGDVTAMPDDNLLVEADGKQVKDFSVASAEPEVMRVERTADGRICLTKLQSFGGRNIGFTLTYDGKDYAFYCNDDGLASLRLIWHGSEIAPEMCFGDVTAVPDDNLLVEVDGEIVTDFTVTSTEPEVMRAERTEDGRICLTKLQGFNGRNIEFTVTYGGQDYSFRCNDDGLPMEAQPQEPSDSNTHYDRAEEAAIAKVTTPQYGEAQIAQWIEEGWSLEQLAEKIETAADALQFLKAIGYRKTVYNDNVNFHEDENDIEWGAIWNAQVVFDHRSGNCGGTSVLMNTLLTGDFDEQGYVEFSNANGGHIFNYFVVDGVYVFCDFVGIPGVDFFSGGQDYADDTRAYIVYAGADRYAFADWYRNEGFFAAEFDNPESEFYLYQLYMYRRDGVKLPKGFDAESERTKFNNIVNDILSEQYRDDYIILYEREGYRIRFRALPEQSEWPKDVRDLPSGPAQDETEAPVEDVKSPSGGGDFMQRRYTDDELQAFVDADLSFGEACDRIATVADAVRYLYLRGYQFAPDDAGVDAGTRYRLNSGGCVGGSALFGALLEGDYDEQGYLYIFYARSEHVIDYFVLDGVYYFCDFVSVFSPRGTQPDRSPVCHVTTDPATIYEAWFDIEPNDLNDSESDMYLAAMYTTGYFGTPTMPQVWLWASEDGKYCRVDLSAEEKESMNLLFLRDGYTFDF